MLPDRQRHTGQDHEPASLGILLSQAGLQPARASMDPEVVADFLHKMSQPLAALRLSLELALLRTATPEQYRLRIKEALEQADRLVSYSRDLRDLTELSTQGVGDEAVDLGELAAMVTEMLAPIGASRGLRISASFEGKLPVTAGPEWLQRALLYIVEDAFVRFEEGSAIEVVGKREKDRIRFSITGRVGSSVQPGLTAPASGAGAQNEHSGWKWMLTKRILEAVGGTLELRTTLTGECSYTIDLPISGGERSQAPQSSLPCA